LLDRFVIRVEYLLLDPSAKREPKLPRELKNSRDARAPLSLLPAPIWSRAPFGRNTYATML